MCGIVAIFAPESVVDEGVLARAISRIRHRGPDGQRQWIATHGGIGLGHARLSVMDPATGAQPIANEDERLRIVVNGELYGFETIRRSLEENGHRFRTCSDSEIVLHLYEERGVACLDQLRGEFAFALWDENNRCLFAARDRFGIKPLFYSFYNGSLYIASEVKALFAAGVPARWDHDAFYQQLFLYQNLDWTLFAGVRQLPPGHYLIASSGGVRVSRYWDLDYPRLDADSHQPSEGQSIEDVRAAFEESVRLRLRADVPVGSFLSGGVDSSAVLGVAAKYAAKPLSAYTIAFSHRDYNEAAIAKETAEHTGSRLHLLTVNESDIADYMGDAVEHAETLGINGHGVGRYLLCRHIQKLGQKVILAGDGSDEIFAGYMQARQDLLRLGSSPTALDGTPEAAWVAFAQRTLGFVPSWMRRLAASRSIFHLLLDSEYAEGRSQSNPYQIFLSQFDIEGQLADRDPLFGSLYLWTRSILPNYSLVAERLEMAWGIETRLPFLDHKLFEVVRELPASCLIRGGTEKYILRQAALPYLTKTVVERAKHPFLAPPASGCEPSRLHVLLQDTMRSGATRCLPFFDQAALLALLDRLPHLHESKRGSVEIALQMIMSACFLQQRYHL